MFQRIILISAFLLPIPTFGQSILPELQGHSIPTKTKCPIDRSGPLTMYYRNPVIGSNAVLTVSFVSGKWVRLVLQVAEDGEPYKTTRDVRADTSDDERRYYAEILAQKMQRVLDNVCFGDDSAKSAFDAAVAANRARLPSP